MRGSRQARSLTAALLVGSSVLAVLGAAERWAGICARTTWRSDACWERRDRLYDQLLPTDPWVPIGHAARAPRIQLAVAGRRGGADAGRAGTSIDVVAGAVRLGVRPRPRRGGGDRPARWSHWPGRGPSGDGGARGALVLVAPLPRADRAVPAGRRPSTRRTGRRPGRVVARLRHAVAAALLLRAYADETVPWTEAGIALPLLVVALLLRPWSRQRSFSNQQRAHSLSL